MSVRRTSSVFVFMVSVLLVAGTFAGIRVTGKPVQISPEGEKLAHPVWSPDGRWIAVTRPNYTGIWLLSPDGSSTRQLTDAPGTGFGMAWSPDGRAILCRATRERDKRLEHAVQVIDVESGRVTFLTRWRRHMYDVPRWLGSNQVVLCAAGTVEAWRLSREENKAEVLSRVPKGVYYAKGGAIYRTGVAKPLFRVEGEGTVLNLRPSPDGQLLAFEVTGGDLYVVSTDGKTVVDLGVGNRPRWSPDSQWLAFFVAKDDGYRYLESDLYAVRPDGSERTRLTSTSDMLEMDPCWSPDGKKLAFYDYSSSAVYTLDLSTR